MLLNRLSVKAAIVSAMAIVAYAPSAEASPQFCQTGVMQCVWSEEPWDFCGDPVRIWCTQNCQDSWGGECTNDPNGHCPPRSFANSVLVI